MWFYRVDRQIYLTTQPARRSWYANILANPSFTFHLEHGVRADLPVRGTPVHDPRRREAVFRSIIADLEQPWNPAGIPQPVEPLPQWLDGSPPIHVEFTEGTPA